MECGVNGLLVMKCGLAWLGLAWLELVCIAFWDGAMGIGVVNGNGDTTGF